MQIIEENNQTKDYAEFVVEKGIKLGIWIKDWIPNYNKKSSKFPLIKYVLQHLKNITRLIENEKKEVKIALNFLKSHS